MSIDGYERRRLRAALLRWKQAEARERERFLEIVREIEEDGHGHRRTEIAEAAGMSKQSLSNLLTRAEQSGEGQA